MKLLCSFIIIVICLSCTNNTHEIEDYISAYLQNKRVDESKQKFFLKSNGVHHNEREIEIDLLIDYSTSLQAKKEYKNTNDDYLKYFDSLIDKIKLDAIQVCDPLFVELKEKYKVEEIYVNLFDTSAKFGELHFPMKASSINKVVTKLKPYFKDFLQGDSKFKGIEFSQIRETTKDNYRLDYVLIDREIKSSDAVFLREWREKFDSVNLDRDGCCNNITIFVFLKDRNGDNIALTTLKNS